MLPLGSDLPDDAGPDIRAVRATHEVGDDDIRQRIGIPLEYYRRINALAVPARAHDDSDAGC